MTEAKISPSSCIIFDHSGSSLNSEVNRLNDVGLFVDFLRAAIATEPIIFVEIDDAVNDFVVRKYAPVIAQGVVALLYNRRIPLTASLTFKNKMAHKYNVQNIRCRLFTSKTCVQTLA